ncbi:transcription initiation factor IID, 18kD subunit-domain-containing protein [Lipomyces tetrasporus]|uniref:Transcription initiation factor IID, 18kD subunit-domain-containing protein n=1 Tax=Lipomyces tetrasporus TaxID=54092 RepID=A0AAD7VWV6_9ASCO|nr:transcription initiation factor IID, 18kD subunit-domain-containing protein [Lipomyces tetrasporus]KAJ8104050.1 transcription initiation factor IID, 18kD subunit-domain-containing protein [Lipomyces tetrasporus]
MSDKYRYRPEIQQMMFVSGETNDPPPETTAVIEDIVRSQVVEMLLQATAQAAKRGSRSIAVEDLIFMIRHDRAKVNRLRTYLSWKDVRKNAKDQEGGAVEGADLLEDVAGAAGAPAASGPVDPVGPKMKYRKSKVKLPWDLINMFPETVPDAEDEDGGAGPDEDELEATLATLQRLKSADERTRAMTKEEYVHWSECRQASFTFRKGKRFRDWASISVLTDSKPNDDIIDILGFLTFEIVAVLTEEAIKVKEAEDEMEMRRSKRTKTRKTERFLFDPPDEDQRPVLAKHVTEAFRNLQRAKPKQMALRNFSGGLVRTKTAVI